MDKYTLRRVFKYYSKEILYSRIKKKDFKNFKNDELAEFLKEDAAETICEFADKLVINQSMGIHWL